MRTPSVGGTNNVIMVDEIAKAKSIPKSFLSKILQKLAKANIVKSYRGVRGGFQIAKAPNHCLTFNPKTINNIIINYYKNIKYFYVYIRKHFIVR